MKLEQQVRAELIGAITEMEGRMMEQMTTEELLAQTEATVQNFERWTREKKNTEKEIRQLRLVKDGSKEEPA